MKASHWPRPMGRGGSPGESMDPEKLREDSERTQKWGLWSLFGAGTRRRRLRKHALDASPESSPR